MWAAIYIMWLRQMKRFLRSKARIVASAAQPLLFLVTFGFGFSAIFRQAGAGNYIDFLAPGIVAMAIVFSSVFSGIEVMWDRQFGFLKETLVAPVPRTALMFGRTLGGATVALLQGLLVLVVTLIVGFRPHNWALLPAAILVMALISIIFTAFGTAIGARLRDMQGFQLIMNFIIMPLFFLSGALFPLDGLPSAMYAVVRADPLSYGVDALRGLLISATHFGLPLDIGVLAVVAVGLVGLGSYFFARIEV
ncbi:MAG TPA: ABC transporter permease [Bauldia sp.]|nr:ABC transporter permease [Bauldia sp.]